MCFNFRCKLDVLSMKSESVGCLCVFCVAFTSHDCEDNGVGGGGRSTTHFLPAPFVFEREISLHAPVPLVLAKVRVHMPWLSEL